MMRSPRILVLTYFSYREGLLQSYTLPYLKLIRSAHPECQIQLVTYEKASLPLTQEQENEAHLWLSNFGISWHPQKYTAFGLRASINRITELSRLLRLVRSKKVETIHAWGTPSGVTGYILSKLSGKDLIIDSFEPHAEAQLENGSWTRKSLGFKILWLFEKRMARHAKTLIYTTRNMISYAKEKYNVYDDREFVKPACVDLELFSDLDLKDENLLTSLGLKGKKVLLYVGKFGGIYHDEAAFGYMKAASDHYGDALAILLLGPTPRKQIESRCASVGLDQNNVISLFVNHSEMPRYMGLADFAIALIKSVPTKKCCTPIKDGEYWALGLPVVITKDISDDSDIIAAENIGYVLQDFSQEEMNRSFRAIDSLLSSGDRIQVYNKIRPIAEKYRNFDLAREIYRSVYQ